MSFCFSLRVSGVKRSGVCFDSKGLVLLAGCNWLSADFSWGAGDFTGDSVGATGLGAIGNKDWASAALAELPKARNPAAPTAHFLALRRNPRLLI